MPEGPLIENPKLRAALRQADQRATGWLRAARLRRGLAVRCEESTQKSAAGYPLRVWVHRPEGATEPLPGVVLCPPARQGGAAFGDTAGLVSADELARLGLAVLRFDPAGRGESWGDEDLCGPEHQDETASLLAWLGDQDGVDATNIGLLGVGNGSVMAVGAAALCGAPAAWVLDFEGPSDRFTWNSDDPVAAPAHRFNDDTWWTPREPARHVASLRCPYVRLQAEEDHARPEELRHALRMVQAAAEGDLPWFQINDHPRGEAPLRPWWLGPGHLRHHRALLRKVVLLSRR